MASAKQIAWRKKFARMSKAGKFKKSKKSKATIIRKVGGKLVHSDISRPKKKHTENYTRGDWNT